MINLNRIKEGFVSFKDFLYNPQTKQVLSRSGVDWAKIGIFYVCFYTGLILFFSAMLGMFYVTVDYERPKLIGENSRLKNSPGFAFRPVPDIETTLISFSPKKKGSYSLYVNNIRSYLRQYDSDTQSENVSLKECSEGNGPNSTGACKYDYEADTAGSPCTAENMYGYAVGTPCVLLKIGKVYGWTPELLTVLPDEVNKTMGERFSSSAVPVSCWGENPEDDEHIGEISYYPQSGFPVYYYPYLNQPGFKSPLQWVSFKNVTVGRHILVQCRVYAKNILIDEQRSHGIVHFELQVDE